jgi:uncharacterized SAM-binding protein YcdF (DUF218 family)
MTLNKLLPIFFSPIVLVCIAIVVGAVLRQRRWSIAGAVFLLLASLPVVADRLFAWSQASVVPSDLAETVRPAATSNDARRPADAIVVLGGAMSYVRPAGEPIAEWGDAIDRVFGGIALARAERAPRLIFLGGSWIGQEGLPSEGDRARELAIPAGVPADRIEVSPQALNTAEEATTIRRMFGAEGSAAAEAAATETAAVHTASARPSEARPTIILVTSAFHMPRAQVTFETEGFEVLPYPVDFRAPVRRMPLMDWLPSPEALEKTDLVIREALGRGYYRLRAMLRATLHTESQAAASDHAASEDAP